MTAPAWIAVDWGTSNVRAWAMDRGGSVLAEAASDLGMGSLAPDAFERAFLDLVAGWTLPDHVTVVACGMVGARQGWSEAAYVGVPCRPLTGGFARAAASDPRLDIRIVPGLSQAAPPDIMRGEETQIAGFLAINPGFDGVIALPGSHTKWVQVSAGEVVSFQTAMTGELFAAIARHTVLRHSLSDGWDDAAFDGAASDGLSRPEATAARLFQIRAAALLDGLAPAAARARLSGLLIGAELAHARAYWLGTEVALVGAPALCALYARALESQGARPLRTRADACTLAGLKAARALLETAP
ncbi:2-dehydro-3-deoxygalactonokinase [Palleronia rufa]|uniref:2-dehydro-3-deoxygalactonokinase n=1 Tax=Palleronia rufa TaxID=1530186 RepID=UPI00055D61E5|nr:2-dehydro-3-deoxygalactonokinase [Palleronia rufa]